jgi:hypothetical protein
MSPRHSRLLRLRLAPLLLLLLLLVTNKLAGLQLLLAAAPVVR